MIGIYRIKNSINDDSYYGSPKNIHIQFNRHRNELKHNKHHNKHLQRAWNKYGEKYFIFEIVEECSFDTLLTTEQKYLNMSPKYNIGMQASGGDNLTLHPNRIDIITRRTKTQQNKMAHMTDEERKQKFGKHKDKNPNWRGGTSIKYCKCGNEMALTAKTCAKCRKRDGELNPFFGQKHTESTIIQLSKNKEGKYDGNQNLPIIIDGIEYRSAGLASKLLGIPMVTIRWRVQSKNKKFDNYQYKS